MIALLAQAAAGFTSTEMALGAVIVTLAGVIGVLGKHVAAQAESRRQGEVEAYKAILPLTSKLVDVLEQLQPLLSKVEDKK